MPEIDHKSANASGLVHTSDGSDGSRVLRRGSTGEPYFGCVLCFECKYLVHVSGNQESLFSSHISMFWAVCKFFGDFLVYLDIKIFFSKD